MTSLALENYNPRARGYWMVLVALGAAAFAGSVWNVAGLNSHMLVTFGIGIVAVSLAGLFPVVMPGSRLALAGGELFIFLILLLFGVQAAVVAAACEAAVISWRASSKWTSRIGGPALASLSMAACGNGFMLLLTGIEHGQAPSVAALFGSLAVFAFCYAALSTLLMSTLISLMRNQPIRLGQWFRDYAWVGLAYALCASIAGILLITSRAIGLVAIFVAVPIVSMFLATLHFYLRSRETIREAELTTKHLDEISRSEERFHSAFTHSAIGMALVGTDLTVQQVNKSFCDMLGYDSESLVGQQVTDFVDPLHRPRMVDALKFLIDDEGRISDEYDWEHRDGSTVCGSLHVGYFSDWRTASRLMIFQLQDVTARRRAEARLLHVAYHDDLTGLPNRAQFHEVLRDAIARFDAHEGGRFCVMYLDFDRFKVINDSLGHKAGDTLLEIVADRMRRSLKHGDVLARLGGDEFAILIREIPSDQAVVGIAERLLTCFKSPVRLGDTEVTTSASIGITLGSVGYRTPEDVLRDADTAMYRAKKLGKARYAIFDAAFHEQAVEQLELEGELRRAIPNRETIVYYQPVLSLARRSVVGFEALVRWQSPRRGLVAPSEFIALAEETGLIVELGDWVLNQACHQLKEWQRSGDCDDSLKMNINVSGVQLARADFVFSVAQALRRHGVRPDQITLEFTESVLIDGEVVIPTMRQLADLGVKLAIDDFGTGYSSLSYLHTLPIDALKIDRSFVARMVEEEQGASIVRSVISLGKALHKTVIAEGIETEAQYAQLLAMGCDEGQGYLFSPAVEMYDARLLLNGKVTPISVKRPPLAGVNLAAS
jgi:diguanylate cyclase (GGDEF)-like protein/PAS domain S-box-containing protein